MELLDGQGLDEMVAQRGALPANEVVSLFEQACHGLTAAHLAGIIHRDLKPENIFVAQARRVGLPFVVKILDFGIAKLTQEAMTASGSQVIGTPFWMAPEQMQLHGRIGPHTDVWALGLVGFYALAGRPYWFSAQPGAEGTLPQFINEAVVQQRQAPSARVRQLGLNVALTPAFDAWFARCLDNDPNLRYPTAAQCLDGLKVALSPAHFSPTSAMGTMALDAGALPSAPGFRPGGSGSPAVTPAPGSYGTPPPHSHGAPTPAPYGAPTPHPHATPTPAPYGSPAGSAPGFSASSPGASTSPGYASYPAATPPPVQYDFSGGRQKKSNLPLYLGLAAAGALALGAVGAIGLVIAFSGDDDSETDEEEVAAAAPTYEDALAECRTALAAQNPALALGHADDALAARPADAEAAGCRANAVAMQAEETTYRAGVAALGRGDPSNAYASFATLPATSAYQARPEIAQATSQLASQRLAEANQHLRPDPARAYLLAESVTYMRGVNPTQLGQGRRIVAQAERRVGTVYEGRVSTGSEAGNACSIAIRSVRNGSFNCRFAIRCGARTIYGRGTSGFNRCRRANGVFVGARDQGMTARDGDPEMSFDLANRRAHVRDRRLDVTMTIVMPGAPATPGGPVTPVPVGP